MIRLFALTFVVRFLISFFIPIIDDEAYYWVWSHFPSLSYFDHPGMISWLVWLGRHLLPWSTGFRLPGIFLSHVAIFMWYSLIQKKWSSSAARTWLALALVHPFIGIGYFIQTPDVPLFFFSTLSIFIFDSYLSVPNAKKALLLGAALGLGFCSKYHIVLMVPVLAVTAFLNFRLARFRFSPFHFVCVLATGLLFCAPVFLWNIEHDWVSFRFQLHHGLGQTTWDPAWTFSYLLGQLILFNPVLFRSLLRTFRTRGSELIAAASLFPWIFFLLSSFRGLVEANWPSLAFAPAYGLVSFRSKK